MQGWFCFRWTFCNLILTNQSRGIELKLIYSREESPLYILTEEEKKSIEKETFPVERMYGTSVHTQEERKEKKEEGITERRYVLEKCSLTDSAVYGSIEPNQVEMEPNPGR